MKRRAVLAITLFFGITQAYSQLIDVSPEIQTVCGGTPATLTAVVTPPGSGSAPGSLPTNSYAITSIPYTPDSYTAGTPVTEGDDTQSGALPIGFNFCFFGTTYSQFYIGSNGWVAFTPQPTTYTSATIPSTAATVPKNCIMGPWQDWYPGLAPNCVRYQTLGVAPFRRLVVSWSNTPMFSCTSTLATFQITIYETSNVIENYLANKPNCLAWAGGTAVQGLHDPSGTVAFVVAGRNSTQWTATNEGWRYTPNGTAVYTINWYILPANTLIASFTTPPYTSTITVTPPTSPQFYYAEVVGPNGCGTGAPNTDTVEVLSSALAVDAGPYRSVCQGTTTTLTASAPGGTTFSWSPTTGLSNPAIANPVLTASTTTTFTVTVTDGIGCTGTDTVTVGVNPAPFADAGSGAAMCNGDNIQLSGFGTGTYSWSPAASLDNASIPGPTASPTVTTTYTLTITDGIGCTATDTATVEIFVVPADAGPNTAVCTGATTTLHATGGVSYTWSPSPTLSNLNISNPIASPTTTTTYTVMVTDVNGCSKSDSVTVTVNSLPVADAGAYTNICFGTNTTLGASGGTTYSWSPAASLSSSSIFNPVANPTATTTYTVVVTDASGCVSNDTMTVHVNALPVVDAGANVNLCVGASTTLNATGASNYSWSPAGSLSNPSIANPVASPSSATTYTVIGTDGHGCMSSDTVRINLNGITITPSADATVCRGINTTLNISGASTYVWSPSASLSSSTIPSPVATPLATTTYTVVGTATSGCMDTAYITVTVNPLPPVNAGPTVSICNGTTTTLNGSGASSYTWSPGGSLSNPNIPNPVASPVATIVYTLVGTDLNGCVNSDTVSVIVKPTPTANAGINTSICNGTSTTLNATGGGAYSWSPGTGLSNPSISNPVAAPASTTSYTVTVTAGNGCTATSQVTISVNPSPSATASADVSICNGASTTLTATGGGTYSWSPSTGLSSSASASPTATPPSTTFYIVTVSNGFGCSDTAGVLVTVNNVLSMASATVVPETCGNTNGSITAGAITGGGAPYTYTLNGGAGQSSPAFTGLSQGTYTLTVTDAGGCSATQTVVVNQVLGVNASFTANPTSGVSPLTVNFTNTSSGASNYIWDFGDGTSSMLTDPSVIYGQNGMYTVILTAYNGSVACSDTAEFTINVFDQVAMIVPNVFTPNGDDRNDEFTIQSVGLKELNGTIFNRWGKKIAEFGSSVTSGWDGKINGNKADDGTYFYVIKAVGQDGKDYEQKGYVQLLGK